MNPRQATRLIATAFVFAIALIAWRHVRSGGAPPPGAFLYPTAMYGSLALVADIGAPTLAGILAAALTVGIGFRFVEVGAVGADSAAVGAGTGSSPLRRARTSSRTAGPRRRPTRRATRGRRR